MSFHVKTDHFHEYPSCGDHAPCADPAVECTLGPVTCLDCEVERHETLHSIPIPPDFTERLGHCYVNALHKLVLYRTATLVHGTITGYGFVNPHAWVVYADGVVYEPTLNVDLHPDDFLTLFQPTVIATYPASEAISIATTVGHYGPWHEEES